MKQTELKPTESNYRKTEEYRAADAFLLGRIDYERMAKMPYSRLKMNLRRMAKLLDLLNNPHQQIDIIHVAGTKGKGSTVAFLTAALNAYGLRCGSYTSPHLHYIEERFRLDGHPIHPEQFVQLMAVVRPAVEQLDAMGPEYQVTYFEIATALGFLYFVQQQVDIAVVEVGLGGRLDSTNVCLPLVSVITSISLDHTRQLGGTLELIAAEKAGIIKPMVPVVSGVVASEPRDVIRSIAKERDATLVERNREFRFCDYEAGTWDEPCSATLEQYSQGKWHSVMSDLKLGTRGEHQAANASVAWATLNLLPERLRPDSAAVRRGFAASHCEARIEIVGTEPLVVFDVAHNPASASALADTLAELSVTGHRWLVLATTRGKDVPAMLERLLPRFDHVICTRYKKNPRAHEVRQLQKMVDKVVRENGLSIQVASCDGPVEAWQRVKVSANPNDCICVTGSFFIAAELRELL